MMDNFWLWCVVSVTISFCLGVIFGKAFARDDAVRLGGFRFAGKVYNVERVE